MDEGAGRLTVIDIVPRQAEQSTSTRGARVVGSPQRLDELSESFRLELVIDWRPSGEHGPFPVNFCSDERRAPADAVEFDRIGDRVRADEFEREGDVARWGVGGQSGQGERGGGEVRVVRGELGRMRWRERSEVEPIRRVVFVACT